MHQIFTKKFNLFALLALSSMVFSQISIEDSEFFDSGSSTSWPYVLTLTTTADGTASQGAQSFSMNIVSLPEGGANYRVYKTNANGVDVFVGATALTLGTNTKTIGAFNFDRTVKIQFSTSGISFDSLTVNGSTLYDSSSSDDDSNDNSNDQCISNSSSFDDGPNETWVKVLTLTTLADGAASQQAQSFSINIVSLPESEANYRVYKTNANGVDVFANATALSLGPNSKTIAAVSFDRTVKIQFSSAEICYDSLTINGVAEGSGEGSDDGSGDGTDDGSGDGSDDGSGDGTDDGSGDGSDDGSGDGTDDGSGEGSDDGSEPPNLACIQDNPHFTNTNSTVYPRQIILAETSDSSSSGSQNLTMTITGLAWGARYQVVKTTMNGNTNYASPVSIFAYGTPPPEEGNYVNLTEDGVLSIDVNEVSFQRNVSIRFDTGDGDNICFSKISTNGHRLLSWTGATDTDWETDSNWVLNSYASSDANVIVADDLSNYPTISTDVSLNELIIDSGASVSVSSSGSLAVGDLSNSGTFTMTGSSTNHPSLIVDGTITGDVTYNRYVNTVGTNEWDLIGSPVDGLSVEDFVNANSSIATNNNSTQTTTGESTLFEEGPNSRYPIKITLTTSDDPESGNQQTLLMNVTFIPEGGVNYRVAKQLANGNMYYGPVTAFILGTNNIIVDASGFERNVHVRIGSTEVAFNSLTVNGTSLYNGVQPDTYAVGYYDNATSTWNNYDDDNFDVGSPTLEIGKGFQMATSSGSVMSFSGGVVTTQVPVSIVDNSSSGGTQWNLIANPFPSYLNLNSAADATNNFITENGLSVYGWSADGSGTYIVYNNVSPTPDASYIAPGQGFFVGAGNGTTSVNFTADMRTTSGGDDFVAGRLSGSYTYFYLDMLNQNGNSIGDSMFYFDDNMTHGYDQGYDAESFDQSSSLMSRLLNGYEGTGMQVNAMPTSSLDDSTIIPLDINRAAGTAFAISLGDSFNIPADVDIYLEDREDQTFTDLKNGDFSITPTTSLSGTGRFYLVFGTNSLGSDDFDMSHINAYKPFNADHIVIEGLFNIETASVSMYNIIGQEVLNVKLNANQAIERVSTLGINAGVYIVNIQADNNTITKKIIIN